MTAVGNLLICVLQVTLVAVFGIAVSLIMRRSLKASAGLPLVITLLSVTLLTFCSFSSWPSWLRQSNASFTSAPNTSGVFEKRLNEIDQGSKQRDPTTRFGAGFNAASTNEALSGLLTWVENIASAAVPSEDLPTSNKWTIGQVVGLLVILCLIVGLIRLVGGLVGVRMFVLTSRPLENRQLRELVDIIRAELGCTRKIAIRESKKLSLAATVGWKQPVVLLSENWRNWSEIQLRSILAHEIAHIRRGDFLATIFAQIGLLLHFYHPLVHWLANRLRLEQELAADAMAAQIVGGSRVYLDAIGELALKHSSEPVGWPAHSFLPTRRTFLRRIEMLRDLKFLSGKGSGTMRWATTIGVLAVTLVAIGLRPPGTNAPATGLLAQDKAKAAAGGPVAEQGSELIARYVPEAAAVVAVIRANQIYSAAEKLVSTKLIPADLVKSLGVIKDVTQVTAVYIPNNAKPTPPIAACVAFNDKEARVRFEPNSGPPGVTWQKANLLLYQYEKSSDGRLGRFFPDDRTLIFGDAFVVEQMILTAGKSLSPLTQTDKWKAATKGLMVASVSTNGLIEFASQFGGNPTVAMFSPLWQSASGHLIEAKLDDQLRISLTTQAKDEAGVSKIEATLQATIAMLSNMLSMAKGAPDESIRESTEALTGLLESHELEATTGTEIQLRFAMDMDSFAKFLVAPLAAAKSAGDRGVHANSMKQIGLAMHQYHSANGNFPPAAIVDPDSGMKRSWRVELLPFLEVKIGLYDEYKKNEPWDSPANMKVLAQMPRVFRHPSQPNDSTMTAVTAAYGNGLLFSRSSKGVRIQDILDGTSNTLVFLEAKTEIPWTKPEDIEVDITKDLLPEFGGFDATGYTVGFADGSVRYFSKSIDIGLLKKLFTIAGGEAIQP